MATKVQEVAQAPTQSSSKKTIIIIVALVIVVGLIVYFLFLKKVPTNLKKYYTKDKGDFVALNYSEYPKNNKFLTGQNSKGVQVYVLKSDVEKSETKDSTPALYANKDGVVIYYNTKL